MEISELERRHLVEALDTLMAEVEPLLMDGLISPEAYLDIVDMYRILGVKHHD